VTSSEERRDATLVAAGFWPKFRRVAARLPFAEDLLAAYLAAADPATPRKVRALLLGALAYFVLPVDAIPDFVIGLGFTDDAAVLALALRNLAAYVLPKHHARARELLSKPIELD
jgi:uncharacterized membrane protein YkvA (DUF1232 family)